MMKNLDEASETEDFASGCNLGAKTSPRKGFMLRSGRIKATAFWTLQDNALLVRQCRGSGKQSRLLSPFVGCRNLDP